MHSMESLNCCCFFGGALFIVFVGDPPFLIACVVAICGGVGFMVRCRFVGYRCSICSPI